MFYLNKAIENEYKIRATTTNILSDFLTDICNYFMILTNTVS